jgi:hypothetical protein
MKSKDQQLLEEAYDSVRNQPEQSAEELLELLKSTIMERNRNDHDQEGYEGYEGIESDSLDNEIDEIWSKLEKMGYTTKQLNQYCQEAGVLSYKRAFFFVDLSTTLHQTPTGQIVG